VRGSSGLRKRFEYWLLEGERILGNCGIRPELIPKIELDGGHISYDIRPSERGRGHGTELLRPALVECRRIGLTRVLLTTALNDERSIRVIRANRGVELDRPVRPSAAIVRFAGRSTSEIGARMTLPLITPLHAPVESFCRGFRNAAARHIVRRRA
jgi:predicted acetyltransferase